MPKRYRVRSLDGGVGPAAGGGPFNQILLLPLVVALCAVLVALSLYPVLSGTGHALKAFNDTFLSEGRNTLRVGEFPERSTIYAGDGSVLATVAEYNRVYVPLTDISEMARKAVLAVEDDRFYEHGPVDFTAIVRAAVANLRAGDIVQGGSTISQQLVKNTYVGAEQTFRRKFQEAQDAIRLERTYSKDQILELYMNNVFLANRTYGFGAGAEFYFNRTPADLTLPQAALLAGMIQLPGAYDPIKNPEAAKTRRDLVLRRMLELGWINNTEYTQAVDTPVKLSKKRRDFNTYGNYPYFVSYVIDRLLDEKDERYAFLGETREERERAVYQGGLRIHTTLKPEMQDAAEAAVKAHLPQQGPRPPDDPQGAVVSIVPRTGEIETLYGGTNFSRQQFNLASQSTRGAGSAFKAFTLVAAFEDGVPPGRVYKAQSPVTIPVEKCGPQSGGGGWKPSNAEGSRSGYMSLKEATAHSTNVVFAQLIADVGAAKVAETAQRMGVAGPTVNVGPYCAITLGAVEVNPLAMTAGYATLANQGVRCEPFAVTRISSRTEKVLYRAKPDCQQVVQPKIAALVTSLLRRVVEPGGTGWRASIGRPVAGKTGTGQEYKDVWFMGYIPQLATGVWVGYSRFPYPMTGLRVLGGANAFGGTLAAPIWHDYMLQAVAGLKVRDFPAPPAERGGTIPSVVGLMQGEAERVLAEANFSPIAQVVDSAEPQGTVVSQSPGGGATAVLGSPVSISVSNGVAPRAPIPNVVGMKHKQAVARLRQAGFVVTVSGAGTEDKKLNDRVISQTPSAGSNRLSGSQVRIVVGKYVAPAPEPPPGGGGGGGG
jgi:1A family penicillin-binding protein